MACVLLSSLSGCVPLLMTHEGKLGMMGRPCRAPTFLFLAVSGGVLGYAQQVTKCCNCSGFIEVLDASNQLVYTIQGKQQYA